MDVVTYAPIGQYLSKYAYWEDRIAGTLKVSDTILLERTAPIVSSIPLAQSTRTVTFMAQSSREAFTVYESESQPITAGIYGTLEPH